MSKRLDRAKDYWHEQHKWNCFLCIIYNFVLISDKYTYPRRGTVKWSSIAVMTENSFQFEVFILTVNSMMIEIYFCKESLRVSSIWQ